MRRTNLTTNRLHKIGTWDSEWFGSFYYNALLFQDFQINRYLVSIFYRLRYPMSEIYIRRNSADRIIVETTVFIPLYVTFSQSYFNRRCLSKVCVYLFRLLHLNTHTSVPVSEDAQLARHALRYISNVRGNIRLRIDVFLFLLLGEKQRIIDRDTHHYSVSLPLMEQLHIRHCTDAVRALICLILSYDCCINRVAPVERRSRIVPRYPSLIQTNSVTYVTLFLRLCRLYNYYAVIYGTIRRRRDDRLVLHDVLNKKRKYKSRARYDTEDLTPVYQMFSLRIILQRVQGYVRLSNAILRLLQSAQLQGIRFRKVYRYTRKIGVEDLVAYNSDWTITERDRPRYQYPAMIHTDYPVEVFGGSRQEKTDKKFQNRFFFTSRHGTHWFRSIYKERRRRFPYLRSRPRNERYCIKYLRFYNVRHNCFITEIKAHEYAQKLRGFKRRLHRIRARRLLHEPLVSRRVGALCLYDRVADQSNLSRGILVTYLDFLRWRYVQIQRRYRHSRKSIPRVRIRSVSADYDMEVIPLRNLYHGLNVCESRFHVSTRETYLLLFFTRFTDDRVRFFKHKQACRWYLRLLDKIVRHINLLDRVFFAGRKDKFFIARCIGYIVRCVTDVRTVLLSRKEMRYMTFLGSMVRLFNHIRAMRSHNASRNVISVMRYALSRMRRYVIQILHKPRWCITTFKRLGLLRRVTRGRRRWRWVKRGNRYIRRFRYRLRRIRFYYFMTKSVFEGRRPTYLSRRRMSSRRMGHFGIHFNNYSRGITKETNIDFPDVNKSLFVHNQKLYGFTKYLSGSATDCMPYADAPYAMRRLNKVVHSWNMCRETNRLIADSANMFLVSNRSESNITYAFVSYSLYVRGYLNVLYQQIIFLLLTQLYLYGHAVTCRLPEITDIVECQRDTTYLGLRMESFHAYHRLRNSILARMNVLRFRGIHEISRCFRPNIPHYMRNISVLKRMHIHFSHISTVLATIWCARSIRNMSLLMEHTLSKYLGGRVVLLINYYKDKRMKRQTLIRKKERKVGLFHDLKWRRRDFLRKGRVIGRALREARNKWRNVTKRMPPLMSAQFICDFFRQKIEHGYRVFRVFRESRRWQNTEIYRVKRYEHRYPRLLHIWEKRYPFNGIRILVSANAKKGRRKRKTYYHLWVRLYQNYRRMPLQRIDHDIRYAQCHVRRTVSEMGIKVWILFRGMMNKEKVSAALMASRRRRL